MSEADAQRIGCDRTLVFDESRITAREAVRLQKATGFSLERVGRALQGTIVRGPDGLPINEVDEDGTEIVRDGKRVPVREVDLEAVIAMIWFCLARAGVHVAFDDLDFDVTHLDLADDEDEEPAGKG